jgi:hypothetical protein
MVLLAGRCHDMTALVERVLPIVAGRSREKMQRIPAKPDIATVENGQMARIAVGQAVGMSMN